MKQKMKNGKRNHDKNRAVNSSKVIHSPQWSAGVPLQRVCVFHFSRMVVSVVCNSTASLSLML